MNSSSSIESAGLLQAFALSRAVLLFALLITGGRELSAQPADSGQLAAVHLRCEYLEDPLGIDVAEPRLSWVLQPASLQSRGLRQTGYRILVASTLRPSRS